MMEVLRMRTRPDKKYCPDPKMKNNMTLYEMAYSMSESDPQDAQEALPYLTSWLLKDFADNYKFNDTKIDDAVLYNISYFIMYNFLNRETCSKIPEVFRTKLLKEIVNMNLSSEFFSLMDDILATTAGLTKTIVTNDDLVHDGTVLRTDNLASSLSRTDNINATDTLTHNVTESTDIDSTTTTNGEVVTDTDTTNNNTKTLGTTSTTTHNTQDQTTFNTTDTTTNNLTTTNENREVLTDYPQSAVSTTVGSWTYASGARDNNGTTQNTGTSTLAKTGTQTDAKTGTTATADTGTVQDAGTGTLDDTTTTTGTTVVDGTEVKATTGTDSTQKTSAETEGVSTTNTGTVNNKSDYSDERDIDTTENWTNMSGFELNAAQLEIFARHDNFYKTLIRHLENCFISVYVDEDRDGWIDPSVNLFQQWT